MTLSNQLRLVNLGTQSKKALAIKHSLREQALQLSRTITQGSSATIRSVHRHELDQAAMLLEKVANAVKESQRLLKKHPDLYFTGYVQDAHKEYAEAAATIAFVTGSALPSPRQLRIALPAYLNGLAEAASELRRTILDALRLDDPKPCDSLLEMMDAVYTVLMQLDFPEALTNGLRRSSDALRGVLERTRGDLTVALRQRNLERQLAAIASIVSIERLK